MAIQVSTDYFLMFGGLVTDAGTDYSGAIYRFDYEGLSYVNEFAFNPREYHAAMFLPEDQIHCSS